MLLTNDGELAHRLMHPSFEIPKTYLATVDGSVARGVGRRLRDGIELDDGPAHVDDFALVDKVPGKTLVRVTLHEGRKRIVRRLLAAVGILCSSWCAPISVRCRWVINGPAAFGC